MPRISTWFVRTALLYLALGFSIGAVLLANKAFYIYPTAWRLLPIHIETLLIGWLVQLAMGVAFWILPRLSGSSPRGNQQLVWLSFALINLGMGVIIIEAIIFAPLLLLTGRLVEVGGVIIFVAGSWKRVKDFGK